jgi:hypothetical protein
LDRAKSRGIGGTHLSAVDRGVAVAEPALKLLSCKAGAGLLAVKPWTFTGEIKREPLGQPERCPFAADDVDEAMYKFMAHCGLEDSPALQRREGLKLDALSFGGGSRPGWLSRATNKISGGFV